MKDLFKVTVKIDKTERLEYRRRSGFENKF